ncbi:hypothetical protein [Streptacidiphilus sp. EB103A]|uniref:hypothetical protein n=1 Tax=Streptacidiphilus sp. EB103A TaxID=3156275 RepID=UPI003511A9E9
MNTVQQAGTGAGPGDCVWCAASGYPGYVPAPVNVPELGGRLLTVWQRCPASCWPRNRAQALRRSAARAAYCRRRRTGAGHSAAWAAVPQHPAAAPPAPTTPPAPAPAPRTPVQAPPVDRPAPPVPAAPAPTAPAAPAPAPAASAPVVAVAPVPARPVQPVPGRREGGARRTEGAKQDVVDLVASVLLEVDGGQVLADVPGLGSPGAKTLEALFAWIASGPPLGVPGIHRDARRHNGTVVLGPDLCRALKLPARLPEGAKRTALGERLQAAAAASGCDIGSADQRKKGDWAKSVATRIAVTPRRTEGVRRAGAVTLIVTPWIGQASGPAQAVDHWLDRLGAPTDPDQLGGCDPRALAEHLRAVAFDLGVPLTGTARVTARTLLESVRPREEWGPNRDGTRILKAGALPDGDTCVEPAAGRWHPLTLKALEEGRPVCREEDFVRFTRPLTDAEAALAYGVELDVCAAHMAITGSLYVPISPLLHRTNPVYGKNTCGQWWCDFTGLRLTTTMLTPEQRLVAEQLLPHPATSDGRPPTGPGWYDTKTVEGMIEWYGFDPSTITEAYLAEHSATLFHESTRQLRDGYKYRHAQLGIGEAMDPAAFLAAYASRSHLAATDPVAASAMVLIDFYKDVYRANTGSWSENPRGDDEAEMARWVREVVESWHYRPEIRFRILAASRYAMYRRLLKTFAATGRAPIAVHVDGIVYASADGDPLALIAFTDAGKQLPGAVRLGIAPGSCKHDATVPMAVIAAALEAGEPLQGAHGVVARYGTDAQLIHTDAKMEGAGRG